MKTGLIIIGIWSLCLFLLSLLIVGAFGSLYDGSFYPFTLPFIVLAGTCVAVAVAGLVGKRIRSTMFWIAAPMHGLLFLPFQFAISRWPGGDDGPGMAWLLFVGGGSCIAGVLSLVLIVIAIIMTVQKKRSCPAGTAGRL